MNTLYLTKEYHLTAPLFTFQPQDITLITQIRLLIKNFIIFLRIIERCDNFMILSDIFPSV